jgi:hydroxymethylbilane synthase
VGNVDTGVILKEQVSGSIDESERLGIVLADKLISLGAKDILKG